MNQTASRRAEEGRIEIVAMRQWVWYHENSLIIQRIGTALMVDPTVSIVLPTHNRRFLVEQALASILAQSFADFEIIVVDDGSTDGTESWLRAQTDPRIRVVRTEHAGAAEARNAGARQAQGRLLAFCDSDDLWMADKLEKQVYVFEQPDAPALLFSDAGRLIGGEPIHETVFSRQPPFDGQIFDPLLLDNFIPTSTVILQKEGFDQTAGFEDVFCPAEDYRLWLRIAGQGECRYLNEPLASYRVHSGQVGSDRSIMFPACARVILDAMQQAGRQVTEVRGLPERLWNLHFVAARELMRDGHPVLARDHYRYAGRYKSFFRATWFRILSYLGI